MIAFTVNGSPVETDAPPFAPLSDTLRQQSQKAVDAIS